MASLTSLNQRCAPPSLLWRITVHTVVKKWENVVSDGMGSHLWVWRRVLWCGYSLTHSLIGYSLLSYSFFFTSVQYASEWMNEDGRKRMWWARISFYSTTSKGIPTLETTSTKEENSGGFLWRRESGRKEGRKGHRLLIYSVNISIYTHTLPSLYTLFLSVYNLIKDWMRE